MFDVPVQMSDAACAEMELPFASLAAGDYLLELNAKADAGTAQELVAFRIEIELATSASRPSWTRTASDWELHAPHAYIPRILVTVATRLMATM